jgi:outer membrane protein
MKKLLSILTFILISNISFSQDLKIGYTNVEYILSFLPETKQVQAEVQAYGTQLQNQLQSKITDFQTKADAFQKSAATMTDIIRADKQEELQNLLLFKNFKLRHKHRYNKKNRIYLNLCLKKSAMQLMISLKMKILPMSSVREYQG